MAWQGGYVADVPYVSGVYPEMAPAHLSACALLGGVRPPDAAQPFRYLELGCGSGVGLAALAAANPHGRFVGMDFNPAHVAAASRLKAEAGLDNLLVTEASFDDFAASPSSPEDRFQYVALRGVWTWVGRQAQLDLLRILLNVTAPGGLVYVGYNDMAGWASSLTLQRVLRMHAARASGDSLARMRSALGFALALERSAPGSVDLRNIRSVLDRYGEDPERLPTPVLSYFAHEYLNESWRPVFPEELEADLLHAKLVHVGSADPIANAPELALSDAAVAATHAYADAEGRRRLGALIAPQGFRGDIFARGAVVAPPDVRAEMLQALPVMLVRPRETAPMEIGAGATRLALDAAVWSPVYDRLAQGPATLGELVDTAKAAGHAVSPLEAALVLLGGGVAGVRSRAADAEVGAAAARRFNVAMMETLRELSGLRLGLASARLGSVVASSLEECLAYMLLAAPHLVPPALADEALRGLARARETFWRAAGVL